VALGVSILAFSQQKKVSWSYLAKKVKDRTFEVRLIATIESGWFIYSKDQPAESTSQPTEVVFTKNPLVTISRESEEGRVIRKRYPSLGYVANTYKDTVAFVQLVTVKGDVKTNLDCVVRFQSCNDYQCLPPESNKFSIMLQ
jgi:thiol:disulfide interchange protein DsbD